MAKLKVEVVTPERRLVQLEADEVIAPGAEGLFGVRPGHAPFLSLLQAGPLTVKDGAKSELYFVAGGFVEVGGQNVRVLADSAQPQKEIDTAAAKKRIGEADEKLKALEVTDPKAEALRDTIRREQKRIEVAAMK
ncbi:MAG: F0F1 ATP synthase subunit epsilon [Archangiaceae bacterium]|nr:F0F1 ATP synthase subunit epsilon [Archangiaceae bacterium]